MNENEIKMYHIYFKNGDHTTYNNFFMFYIAQKAYNDAGTVELMTVEEPWVDLQKECMEALKSINILEGAKNENGSTA